MTERVAELEAQNALLTEQLLALQVKYDGLYESMTAKIQSLIEENEILADANRIMLENKETYERVLPTLSAAPVEPALSQIPDELLLPGGGIETTLASSMDDVHTMGNLLSVASPVNNPEIAVTGGVDKYIMAHDWKHQRKICQFQANAPVLDIAFNPSATSAAYFVAAFMDAKHTLFMLTSNDGAWQIEEVAKFHDHTRPGAMRVAWSTNGKLFATASCDKSVHLYRCEGLDSQSTEPPSCEKIKSYYFNGIVEAMTFVPPAVDGSENELLAIAARDDCYVHYVDCKTFEKERINMNQDGIEHVSYTIMDLRVSPKSGKYLLAATDKDRHFIFPIKSNVVYRNLFGHKAGPYSQPRAVWHPSEKYVISNTEEGGVLFVWCIASERVIEQIPAHDKLIRGISVVATADNNGDATVLTVSYDKRLKAWSSRALGSSRVV